MKNFIKVILAIFVIAIVFELTNFSFSKLPTLPSILNFIIYGLSAYILVVLGFLIFKKIRS